ncbi:ATM interactor [Manis javanica]|nr:ATM interactor [Manis javanica]
MRKTSFENIGNSFFTSNETQPVMDAFLLADMLWNTLEAQNHVSWSCFKTKISNQKNLKTQKNRNSIPCVLENCKYSQP